MSKVLVDRKDLEAIRDYELLGKGYEGSCYFIDDDYIVKLFNEYRKNRKIYFDDMVCNQIAFPIEKLYTIKNKLLVGYTMKYLEGQKFINGFLETLDISSLKVAYVKIRYIILNLKNIYMDDNCLENMLYDYELNKINIIDTSRWIPSDKEDINLDNIKEFNWQLMTALLRNINWKQFKLNHDKSLYELFMTYNYSEDTVTIFLDFLNELESVISNYKGYKVKTIKDLKI